MWWTQSKYSTSTESNDPDLTRLSVFYENEEDHDHIFIFSDNTKELGWLGYYIGKNTTLNELCLGACPRTTIDVGVETFRIGLGLNKSIQNDELSLLDFPRDNIIFHMVDLFLKNNNNLTEIVVDGCEFGAEGGRLLSSMLGECNSNKTLKNIKLANNEIEVGQTIGIILALSMHPQL